jgi:hypothetical protein
VKTRNAMKFRVHSSVGEAIEIPSCLLFLKRDLNISGKNKKLLGISLK